MEVGSSNRVHGSDRRLLAAVAPVLLISTGYIDPGKWVSCIDSGARFGSDLVPFLLLFNLFGILCYYLSGHISLITGRNLAGICNQEYGKLTCLFLGLQAELSVICLDLTMILGIAQGLSMIVGMDLFSSVLLTAMNVVLYPLFSTFMESSKFKVLVIYMAGLTFIFYVLGMLISLPEFPITLNGFPKKLSGESAFALMSLLGANVMPHYFYLHSSVVQRYHKPSQLSNGVWSHDNIIITFTISSGIFLVNYVLMNSAVSAFYNTGLGLVTFEDFMTIVDQAFRNPIVSVAFFVILFLANQITALSWEFCAEGGETILHDFFKMDLPVWLHRATVRIIAVVLALYCLWHSGAEGMYRTLACTQVIVALLLPSSMIPLFRIASSRTIMGVFKISPLLEFIVLIAFMGMLGLEIIFMVEMIFGESDWVGNLQWDMGNTTSIAYFTLLSTACISLSFMLWLAATPLKSASASVDSHPWSWDSQQTLHDSYTSINGHDAVDTRYQEEEPLSKQEFSLSPEKSLHTQDLPDTNYDLNLPETNMDSVPEHHLTTIEENEPMILSTKNADSGQSIASCELASVSSVVSSTSVDPSLPTTPIKREFAEPVEKTLIVEGASSIEKDEEEGNTWDSEELSKDASGVYPPATQESPGSFRSLSGKSDEGGASTGSLSRLSGLGRAARRQFAAFLDEFWGQLYDTHGQMTSEAKSKKLDLLLGIESRPSQSLIKAHSTGKDVGMQFQPLGCGVSDNPLNLSLYDASNQQKLQNYMDSACRFPSVSDSIWSNQTPSLDRYGQVSNRRVLETGERQYQSLHLPPSSEGLEYQPATVHGYQLASYLNRVPKDRSDYVNGQIGSAPQKSSSLVPNNYGEPHPLSLGQKSTNGLYPMQPSSYQNLAVQRNNLMQSDKQHYDPYIARSVENLELENNAKKYYSLPDISGLSVSFRNPQFPDRSTNWDMPKTSVGYGVSVGHEQSSYASAKSGVMGPLAFDELCASQAYSMRLNSGSNAGSLWSRQPFEERQPFEQFGVANKTISYGAEGPRSQTKSMAPDPEHLPLAEMESKLLQSLRICILKLLKLDGSEWLFKPNDGVDEDLIDRVASRERFFCEIESQDLKQAAQLGESQSSYSERKPGHPLRGDDGVVANLVSSVPQCGESCVWKVDLMASFGVWCIHRILELSLMESRPELWGKYTFVLNRLQGIIDLAFSKPRTPMSPCFCLQVPTSYQPRSSPPVANSSLPPAARLAKGKVTTAPMLLDIIKDVEMAISCRKGRSGTAAGDVAFPRGRENLSSVLKRYKRRLSNKSG